MQKAAQSVALDQAEFLSAVAAGADTSPPCYSPVAQHRHLQHSGGISYPGSVCINQCKQTYALKDSLDHQMDRCNTQMWDAEARRLKQQIVHLLEICTFF